MTEAVDMLLRFSFEKIRLEKIKLRIISENEESKKLAERFGFIKKEVTYMNIKDVEREVFHYELVADDYNRK
jgi:RimJ/RimL family protein N-acetyltransferase